MAFVPLSGRAIVALLGAATLAAIQPALAQQGAQDSAAGDAPSLRRAAVVDGDVITLGDILDGCVRRCATPLFRAPAPGESGTIQAPRVVAAARDAGVFDIDLRAARQIVVTRTGRAATREDIDGAIAQAIASRTTIAAGDMTIALDRARVKLSLPTTGNAAPLVADLLIDTRARRFSATLSAPDGSGAPVGVTGSYVETISVPVLSRSIQKGDAIEAGDIIIERRDRDGANDGPLLSPQLAVGRVARQALRAGAPLRERDLVKPLLVERNMPVVMTLLVGGLQLTLKGKAAESGALGDTIGVQNLTSKRVVQGVVTGPGQATILQPSTTITRTVAQR